jgi:hypothetical protein
VDAFVRVRHKVAEYPTKGGLVKHLKYLALVVTVAAAVAAANATAVTAADVAHGFPCVIGLPTPDNQGVYLTTTKSVQVQTDNGAAVVHCTFTQTGYTPPDSSFPFNCNVAGTPADVQELHIAPNGTVEITCVVKP